MRRIKRSLSERKLRKGGSGGGSGGTTKTKGRQKLNRTSTNTADKSLWKQPPEGKYNNMVFYKGDKIEGKHYNGNVIWTINGSSVAMGDNTTIPAR